ncbi:glycosyltransferase family 2 protein [bacterium]|nr:glycosyltransferase family 2 protein [bacterium]
MSVIITTFNEERNIGRCLDSLYWAENINVIDSFSTDKTVEIVNSYDKNRVKVIQHKYESPAQQKNWAIEQVKGKWILILDADEVLTEELIKEIKQVISHPSKTGESVAYKIYRSNFFLGKRIRFSGWQNDFVIRLFRKGNGKYNDVMLHEKLIVDGKLGKLKNKMEHFSFWTVDQYLDTMRRYTSWAAMDKFKKGKGSNFFIIFWRANFKFFRNYFLKLGFLDGFYGWVLCSFSYLFEIIKYVKLYGIYKKKDRKIQ